MSNIDELLKSINEIIDKIEQAEIELAPVKRQKRNEEEDKKKQENIKALKVVLDNKMAELKGMHQGGAGRRRSKKRKTKRKRRKTKRKRRKTKRKRRKRKRRKSRKRR